MTTTPEPGCCKGDGAAANDKCNLASHAQSVCKPMAINRCFWVEGGDVEVDCMYTATGLLPQWLVQGAGQVLRDQLPSGVRAQGERVAAD